MKSNFLDESVIREKGHEFWRGWRLKSLINLLQQTQNNTSIKKSILKEMEFVAVSFYDWWEIYKLPDSLTTKNFREKARNEMFESAKTVYDYCVLLDVFPEGTPQGVTVIKKLLACDQLDLQHAYFRLLGLRHHEAVALFEERIIANFASAQTLLTFLNDSRPWPGGSGVNFNKFMTKGIELSATLDEVNGFLSLTSDSSLKEKAVGKAMSLAQSSAQYLEIYQIYKSKCCSMDQNLRELLEKAVECAAIVDQCFEVYQVTNSTLALEKAVSLAKSPDDLIEILSHLSTNCVLHEVILNRLKEGFKS